MPGVVMIRHLIAVFRRKKFAILLFPLWIAAVLALSDIHDPMNRLIGKFIFNYLVLLLCTVGYFFFVTKKHNGAEK